MAREAQSNRANPIPFLSKIYDIVDNPDNKDLVSWTANGASFVVWDTAAFARDMLPKYFKHNNFASFVRQLNNYGFRKLPDFDIWQHDLFKRGEKHLLVEIRRKTSAASRAASVVHVTTSGNAREDQVVMSSPTNAPLNMSHSDIVKELMLLRKENAAIKKELHELKSRVQNVSGFQEDLADNEPAIAFMVESSGNDNAEESTPAHREIDLNRAWVGGPVDAAHSSDVNPAGGLDLKL